VLGETFGRGNKKPNKWRPRYYIEEARDENGSPARDDFAAKLPFCLMDNESRITDKIYTRVLHSWISSLVRHIVYTFRAHYNILSVRARWKFLHIRGSSRIIRQRSMRAQTRIWEMCKNLHTFIWAHANYVFAHPLLMRSNSLFLNTHASHLFEFVWNNLV